MGHVTYTSLVRRPLSSAVAAVYKFQQAHQNEPTFLWASCWAELKHFLNAMLQKNTVNCVFSWPSMHLFATIGKHMHDGFPCGGHTAGVAFPAATRQGNTCSKCDVAHAHRFPDTAHQMHDTYTAQSTFHTRARDRVTHRTSFGSDTFLWIRAGTSGGQCTHLFEFRRHP